VLESQLRVAVDKLLLLVVVVFAQMQVSALGLVVDLEQVAVSKLAEGTNQREEV
jgi:hypothetical protein